MTVPEERGIHVTLLSQLDLIHQHPVPGEGVLLVYSIEHMLQLAARTNCTSFQAFGCTDQASMMTGQCCIEFWERLISVEGIMRRTLLSTVASSGSQTRYFITKIGSGSVGWRA